LDLLLIGVGACLGRHHELKLGEVSYKRAREIEWPIIFDL